MTGETENNPPRPRARRRFDGAPDGPPPSVSPAEIAAEGQTLTGGFPGSPPTQDVDATMTGGLGFSGGAESARASDGTLTGGLGFAAAPGAVSADLTLTGGLGNARQSAGAIGEQTLTGGFGHAPALTPQQDEARALRRLRALRGFGADAPPLPGGAGMGTRKILRVTPETSPARGAGGEWQVGDIIQGKYEVTGIAGRGGMGVVYKVHHREWHIDMAVKTPLPALVRDWAAKARFLREAQIWVDLGLHPNLVQCWYVRELDGVPRVFVDYLAGGSLKDWFVQGRVGPGQWALLIDLMVQACDGLGYAHERGVVHRDIKPGNMLLSAEGRLCITDFGLVKIAGLADIQSDPGAPEQFGENTELTRTGLSLGTPQYGAPEQWGQARHVDARADIYALGITLYELSCGRRPFDESGRGEPAQIIIARHLTSRPPDPRGFRKDLPDALAEIALHCLAKKPEDRPQSLKAVRQALADAYHKIVGTPYEREAPELAESRASALNNRAVSMWDLNQPRQAHGAWDEALQQDPRHAETVYNRSLLEFRAGTITDVEAEQRLREAARVQPRALLYLGHLYLETCNAEAAEKAYAQALADPALANDGMACRALGHARMALSKFNDAATAYAAALAQMPHDETSSFGATLAQRGERHLGLRPVFPNIGSARIVEDRIGTVHAVAFAIGGRSIFSDGALNSVAQFDVNTGQVLNNYRGHTKEVLGLAPTPDGRFLIGGGQDSVLRAWDLQTGFTLDNFYGKGHIGAIHSVTISPDGSVALTGGSDKSARLWELEKGTSICALWGHEESVRAALFAPDGTRVFSAGDDATIRVWRMPDGSELAVLRERLTAVKALAFAADGSSFYSAGAEGRIIKWDAATLQPLLEFNGHRGTVNAVAVVPGGRFVLSGGDDNTIRLWDGESGCCLRTLQGHRGPVNALALSADGRLALSGANENLGRPLRLWNIELERYTLAPGAEDFYAGALVVSRVEDNSKAQLASRQFRLALQDALAAFERSQFGASYAALKRARKVPGYERDPRALELNSNLTLQLPLKRINGAYLKAEIVGPNLTAFKAIHFAEQGRRALTLGRNDKRICTWDLDDETCASVLEEHKQAVLSLAVAEGAKTLISGSADFTVGMWDLESGALKSMLKDHRAEVNAVAVSRDERLAASVSSDGSARVWELASGRSVRVFAADEKDPQPLCGVKFLHDGRALLTAGFDGALKLWSLVTGKFLRDFRGHSGEILDLAVFADRPHFLSAGEDKTLRLWNAENGQCLWTARDGQARFNAVALSPDRRFIFSGGLEGPDSAVRVWDAASGAALTTLCAHKKGIASVALSPDARRLLTGSEDNLLRIWELEWELAGVDSVSALTGQFKGTGAGSSASAPAIRAGTSGPRSSAMQSAVNLDAGTAAESNKRLSVFSVKDKPKT